jgi:hypothetical protein
LTFVIPLKIPSTHQMKLPRWLIIATIVICIGVVSFAFKNFIFPKQSASQVADKKERGFAVVELFTSEGCSSCPPADNLLARIQKEDKDKAVYLLAYHVDYWDRQGWKDGFSDAAFTQHQQQYAEWLRLNTVYTPQMVVNGKQEFVGSNEAALKNAIGFALKDSSGQSLSLQTGKVGNQVTVTYHSGSVNNHLQVLIAVVQPSAETTVKAGENAGRVLYHVQIVRKLLIEPVPSAKGTVTFSLPGHETHWEVVGMLQNKTTGEIVAAARTEMKN